MKGYEIGKIRWICIVLKFCMDNPVGIIAQPPQLIINGGGHSNATASVNRWQALKATASVNRFTKADVLRCPPRLMIATKNNS